MSRIRLTLAGLISVLMAATVVATAGNVSNALVQADGRKKAAENGARDIKRRGSSESDTARGVYTEAATRHNAWVEALCASIEQGTASAPDVATIEPAASALVAWLNARNRFLGVSEMTAPIEDSVKRKVVQELTEISTASWKTNRGADPKRRSAVATSLKERLAWRTWEEIQ